MSKYDLVTFKDCFEMKSVFHAYTCCSQPTYDTLIVVTPEISSTLLPEAITHLQVNVVFPGEETIKTNSFFDYRQNPLVKGVSPTSHFVR
jgi:hypothetical protein